MRSLVYALLFVLFIPGVAAVGQTKSSAHKRATTSKSKKKKKPVSPRITRIKRAFVASADLKPMARQLLENRTPPAYAGVEGYARKHPATDAGALAWLAAGYAHVLDHDYAKAVDPLKKAQAHAGELGDYIAYYTATSSGAQGNAEAVVSTLRDFQSKYSDSLLARDAAVIYANALVATGDPKTAVAVLLPHRTTAHSDLELALGRAYAAAGDNEKAAEALRRVYFQMPLSPEASDAKVSLDRLSGVTQPTFADRKGRADLLLQAHHYADAAHEFRDLLSEASPDGLPAVQVSLGSALHHSDRDRDARDILERVPASDPSARAQALYYLVEMARNSNDEDRLQKLLTELRQTAPTSPWLDEALLQGANMYLLRKDYDRAIDFYREMNVRFPAGKHAPYAHWKAAWLTLRQGRNQEAARMFEEQVQLYPAGSEIPAALYWRARLAEENHEVAKARAYYAKLDERFPHYYYSDLARERLDELKQTATVYNDPLLNKIPATARPGHLATDAPAPDDLHAQKALLLENGGLDDFAVRELQAAASHGDQGWAMAEVARLYQDEGRYYRALQTLKHAVPSYYALDIDELPREYWEALFPRPYWTNLRRYALANQLDPFLVASLIRQESEFNPGAISRANALGLMQLLPNTGKKVAHELRVRPYSETQLLDPNVNLQLGTRYFRSMVNHFGGRLEYALAAYNAGADRVEGWLSEGKYRDPAEFVESIPFTETREYVQAIMRNASVYRRLYATP